LITKSFVSGLVLASARSAASRLAGWSVASKTTPCGRVAAARATPSMS
jgi:hypothetical protein